MAARTPADWIRALEERGVELWTEGDRLRFRAPRGAIAPEERAELSAQRAGICAALRARAAAGERTAPLSFSQQSLWFIQQQAPASPAYHVGIATRVLSAVDVPALQSALQALVDRHASLRTSYPLVDGAPAQRIAGAAALALELHEVPGLDEDALRARVQEDHDRPFDVEGGPLIRASLFTRGPADHVLLVNVHHIAADGWSLLVMLDELVKLYAEGTGGPPAGLARPALEYAEHARWQEEHLAGPAGARLWTYWREQLAALPPPADLPTDRPRPAMKSFRGDSAAVALSPAVSERLKELAREEGTTTFVVLLACFQALVQRLTGAEDVLVGTPTFARGRPELLGVVGDFVNSVALRGHPAAAAPFRALVRELRGTVLGALDHEELPLPLLVQRLHVPRDSSRSPLFEHFFLLQRFDQFRELAPLLSGSPDEAPVEVGGLRLVPYVLHQQEGQFDLTLHLVERQGAIAGAFRYSTDLYEAATVRRYADGFVALVEAAAADPDRPIGELPAPERPGAAAAALLERLRGLDVHLRLEGGKLRVNAPKGALDEELKGLIAARRDALVEALRAAEVAAGPALAPIPRDGPLPLSAAQQRRWAAERAAPNRSHAGVGLDLRLRGRVDPALLRRTLDELVRRHEPLRARFAEEGGAPRLELVAGAAAALELADLGALSPEARHEEALRQARAFVEAPYDVARGPLGRFRLARLGPDDHLLTLALHHAAGDAWSLVVLAQDLARIHDALEAGRPLPAPPSLQHADFAAWERARLAAGHLGGHLAWWRRELEGAPGVLELPTDRPRPARPSLRQGRARLALGDAALLEALRALSRRREATLHATLLAAVQVVLGRYAGQGDVVLGTPVANREAPALEGVVGPFANHVLVRGRLDGGPSFAELVDQAKRSTLGALEHQALPFDLLVEGLRAERADAHAPLFQVLFAVRPPPPEVEGPAAFRVEAGEPVDAGDARLDLTIELAERGGALEARYGWAADLLDAATVERLNAHLGRLLEAAAAAPDTPVQDLPLLTAADEAQLARFNDTALAHDRARCVHHLVEATARATPAAPAVSAGDVTLSYAELDARANRLARLLEVRGVKPGALVAVCLDRTSEIPVALLAIHKAGAAYVPLDPAYPADRIRYVLEDAGVACAVTLRRYAALFEGARAPLAVLDEAGPELEACSPAPFPSAARAEDRAYVIYTSGSTGRPKGVEVEHRNVVAFLEAMRRTPGCGPADVLLAVTTLSFDIAGLELWLPLSTGARVVIASRTDVLDGERLVAMLAEHGVSLLQATPATWRLMLDAGWAGRPTLRALCGGEALPRDLAAALLERVGELWNVYGPTETTIWSTVERVTDAAGPVTIGRPIANTRVWVLEPSGRLAPIGVQGELVIGGEGVARGYHARPELTAERFVTFAPAGAPERAYRTGDVARLRADGRVDFLGRRDHQVKVRGHRIELGEIEAVLASHPGVKECVVIVREDAPGDQRLVGYVVATAGAPFDAEAARGTLRAKLPEYMLPNLFQALPALPLTPNGKIDRKALPRPEGGAPRAPDAAEALFTPAQRRVAAAWREVLRTDRVGLHDNFFDLGGHSLLLVRLHAALRREFGGELGLVELFQWTTVAAQAARLTADAPDQGALRRAQARAARQTHA